MRNLFAKVVILMLYNPIFGKDFFIMIINVFGTSIRHDTMLRPDLWSFDHPSYIYKSFLMISWLRLRSCPLVRRRTLFITQICLSPCHNGFNLIRLMLAHPLNVIFITKDFIFGSVVSLIFQ